MIAHLNNMVADGHIASRSAELGRSPEAFTGIDRPTIGYELEITAHCAPDTPVLSASDNTSYFALDESNQLKAGRYGYYLTCDEEFELVSPVGNTPLQLGLITNGLVRIGWIPEQTDSEAPLHINLGVPELPSKPDKQFLPRAVDMLRVIDILGATSAERLEQAYIEGETIVGNWDDRGSVGVSLTAPHLVSDHPIWEGGNARMELRSPTYKNLNQFLSALEKAYYLTAGLSAYEESTGQEVYSDFEKFAQEYFAYHNLPSASEVDLVRLNSLNALGPSNRRRNGRNLKKYLQPFVDHIREGDSSAIGDLSRATTEAMVKIRRDLAMEEVPMATNGEITL